MLLTLLISLAHASCPEQPDPLALSARLAHEPAGPAAELAARLAPVVHIPWARQPERRAWDLPAAVDFDGNLNASDNMESILSGDHDIEPTVYWTVLETDTHVFATYHFFHPVDWSPFVVRAARVSAWHENDGENLQVVARKNGDALQVELMALQAHGRTRFVMGPQAEGVRSQRLGLQADQRIRVDKDGRPHVLMERGGHGLWPLLEEPPTHAHLRLSPGLALPPDPQDSAGHYQLLGTLDTFGGPTRGYEEGLLAQSFSGCSELTGAVQLPRHYDSDWLAAPGRRDAGISPYALGLSLLGPSQRTWLGDFYLDPAASWMRAFDAPPEPWSLRYLDYPFAPAIP